MKIAAIIAAGGSGSRMKGGKNKLFIEIQGRSILEMTLDVFEKSDVVHEMIISAPINDIPAIQNIINKIKYKKISAIVEGGATRQLSVYNALQKLPTNTGIVVIHDAARPFITEEILMNSVNEAKVEKAVIVGMPVKDTIKVVGDDRLVSNTPDRETLWQVQTPQVFAYDLIMAAHHKAAALGIFATDDAGLVERLGAKVLMIEGSYDNIKITTPEDLVIGEAISRSKS